MIQAKSWRSPLVVLSMFPMLLCAQQPDLEWSEQLEVAGGTQDLLRPRIVLNSDLAPVILWGTNTSAANQVAVQEGGAFSIPQTIHPEGMQVAVADWQGSDLVSMGNTIHAVLKRIPESTGGIYLVSSFDGGFTWSDTLRVDQIPGHKSRFSSVALNSNGEPLVQYMRIDMQETDHRYLVSRIADGIVHPPVDVSSAFTEGEDCDCCPGQIVASGDDVVALFRDATANVRVIWGAASSDGGATFPQGAQLDPTGWTLGQCPASGPAGFISGDSLYYTWMSGAVSGQKVYAGSASLPDLNAGPLVEVHTGQPTSLQQNNPRIAGSGDTLGIVWQQVSGGQTEILFSWSLSGLQGLSVPDTVNVELAGPQRTPDIAFANGTFHITWADPLANTIGYRSATLSPFIGVAERGRLPVMDLWPVPATDVLNFPPFVDRYPDGRFELFDGRGGMIASHAVARVIPISDHPAGIYTLILKDRNGKAVGTARYSVVR